MKRTLLSSSAAFILLGSAASNAGGYTTPVVDPAPVAPVVLEQMPTDWVGGYAGATLGYAFGGDDDVGLFDGTTNLGRLGKLELDGANAGIRAGYLWQYSRWVFGPEIGYEAGNIKDSFGFDDGLSGGEFKGKAKDVIALRVKSGYAVSPETLIYGIAGVASGKFEYSAEGAGQSFKDDFRTTGYIVGFGAEQKLTDMMSITAEYEYANFGSESITLDDVQSTASPDYSNIKVGVNFRF